MNRALMYVATCLFSLTGTFLHADGKMYREEVPVGIPYQRAILMYADGEETLVLQSKYSFEAEGNAQATSQTLSWIVPVPAVPELASMDGRGCHYLFYSLVRSTSPYRIPVIRTLCFSSALFCLFLSIMFWLVCKFHASLPVPSWLDQERASLCAGLFFDLSIILVLIISLFGPSMGSKSYTDVDVVAQEQVGIYNTRVVEAKDSLKLITWLNENNFKFSDADKVAFDSYIDRGWVFVIAEVAMREVLSDDGNYEGLPDPLILRFPAEKPVYPLVLTGTAGHDTKVLLYLLSDKKMECDARLALRYANPREWYLNLRDTELDPPDFFEKLPSQFEWVHRFRSVLSPEDMQEDLFFYPAKDQESYRGIEVRW